MSYQEKYLKYRTKYLALKSNIKKYNQSQTHLDNNINLEAHDGKIFDIDNLTDTPNFNENKNNLQLGGRGNSTKMENKSFRTLKNQGSFNQTFLNDSKFINNLTETPKLIDIWGGYYTNNKEVNNLVRLLSDTDNSSTPSDPKPSEEPSKSSEQPQKSSEESTEQSPKSSEQSPKSSEQSPKSSEQPSNSESPLSKESPISKKSSEQSSEQSSSHTGGKNSNSHKKFFFEESESTETSNSEHNSSQIGGKKPNSHKKFFFEESDIFSSSETSNSDLLTLDSSTINSSDSDL
jgi:hypothetical protein